VRESRGSATTLDSGLRRNDGDGFVTKAGYGGTKPESSRLSQKHEFSSPQIQTERFKNMDSMTMRHCHFDGK
jgi:hypothetical protein